MCISDVRVGHNRHWDRTRFDRLASVQQPLKFKVSQLSTTSNSSSEATDPIFRHHLIQSECEACPLTHTILAYHNGMSREMSQAENIWLQSKACWTTVHTEKWCHRLPEQTSVCYEMKRDEKEINLSRFLSVLHHDMRILRSVVLKCLQTGLQHSTATNTKLLQWYPLNL